MRRPTTWLSFPSATTWRGCFVDASSGELSSISPPNQWLINSIDRCVLLVLPPFMGNLFIYSSDIVLVWEDRQVVRTGQRTLYLMSSSSVNSRLLLFEIYLDFYWREIRSFLGKLLPLRATQFLHVLLECNSHKIQHKQHPFWISLDTHLKTSDTRIHHHPEQGTLPSALVCQFVFLLSSCARLLLFTPPVSLRHTTNA